MLYPPAPRTLLFHPGCANSHVQGLASKPGASHCLLSHPLLHPPPIKVPQRLEHFPVSRPAQAAARMAHHQHRTPHMCCRSMSAKCSTFPPHLPLVLLQTEHHVQVVQTRDCTPRVCRRKSAESSPSTCIAPGGTPHRGCPRETQGGLRARQPPAACRWSQTRTPRWRPCRSCLQRRRECRVRVGGQRPQGAASALRRHTRECVLAGLPADSAACALAFRRHTGPGTLGRSKPSIRHLWGTDHKRTPMAVQQLVPAPSGVALTPVLSGIPRFWVAARHTEPLGQLAASLSGLPNTFAACPGAQASICSRLCAPHPSPCPPSALPCPVHFLASSNCRPALAPNPTFLTLNP